jgi:hypothetical protein
MPVPAFSDRNLEQLILSAQNVILSWSERNELWDDSGLTSYAERVKGELGEEAVFGKRLTLGQSPITQEA